MNTPAPARFAACTQLTPRPSQRGEVQDPRSPGSTGIGGAEGPRPEGPQVGGAESPRPTGLKVAGGAESPRPEGPQVGGAESPRPINWVEGCRWS